ncbi:MAG: MCE family protein [Cyclobacteriaceae bacterium]|nr:MCE family protein [Cyclobacteriaceae bacterium]
MENTTGRTIRLGVFVTLGVIIFISAVYLLGQKQSLFSQTFTIRALFGNVNGLQTGNNVRFSGINVGSVTHVIILNDSLIEVRMRIRESFRPYIKKNAIASVGTDGLMGNKIVNIAPEKGTAEPVENDYLIKSYSRTDADAILSTLNITNENAALLTKNLVDLTNQIKDGEGILNDVFYSAEISHEVKSTITNLRLTSEKTYQITKQLAQLTHDLKDGEGTLGWLLTDTVSKQKITMTFEKLENTAGKLQAVTDSLNTLINQMKDGEGTVSVLVNDTILANDVKQTLHNLNEGTSSLQQNMEALRYTWPFKKGYKKLKKEKKKMD